MEIANAENSGKIISGNKIGCLNEPYMCINFRNRWVWKNLKEISKTTLGRYKDGLIQAIGECVDRATNDMMLANIEISNVLGSSSGIINGLWLKTNENDFLTWEQVKNKICLLSDYLRENLSKGDRCVLLSENRPEWLVADISIMLALKVKWF